MLASVSPPITVRLASCLERRAGEMHGYRIAGQAISSDVAMDYLAPYADMLPSSRPWPAGAGMQAPATHERAAVGWLAGEDREVRCAYSDTQIVIGVDGVGRFRVARPSGGIACLEAEPGLSPALLEEALLGPPLTFALIQRDMWCLHASAVLTEAGAVLFLGASGDGKSTLAAWLGRTAAFATGPLADDILPCSAAGGSAMAHGHFPQLKWPADEQYPLVAPVTQPIRALVLVCKAPASAEAALTPAGPAQAAKLIAEQTVGVKLFDRELHQRHLAWVSRLIGAARCGRLTYPHDPDGLPRVAEVVGGFLEV